MLCHQIPAMLQVLHHLGMFYQWRPFNMVPIAHVICSR